MGQSVQRDFDHGFLFILICFDVLSIRLRHLHSCFVLFITAVSMFHFMLLAYYCIYMGKVRRIILKNILEYIVYMAYVSIDFIFIFIKCSLKVSKM